MYFMHKILRNFVYKFIYNFFTARIKYYILTMYNTIFKMSDDLNILDKKSDFGISFCGGGLRAYLVCYGTISGLFNKLNEIKYASIVSGSSWFLSELLYYDKRPFDKYIEPENCTLNNLSKFVSNSYGEKIHGIKLIYEAGENFAMLGKKNKFDYWFEIIHDNFFEKYSPNDKIKPNLSKYPCPIINGSVYYNGITEQSFHIMFMPDKCIVPMKYNKFNVDFGGYEIDDEEACKNYDMSDPCVQTSISSQVIDSAFLIVSKNKIGGSTFNLYNPLTNQINNADVVDGGMFDNSGIISLLRNKVKNINVVIPLCVSINARDFFTQNEFFTSLFMGNVKSDVYGIFQPGVWDVLYQQMQDKFNKGEPLTILLKNVNILSNSYFQIDAYGPINLLIHLTSKSHKWMELLPFETKSYINTLYSDFPHFSMAKLKYSSKLINLMYSKMIWDIKNSHEYNEFYSTEFNL